MKAIQVRVTLVKKETPDGLYKTLHAGEGAIIHTSQPKPLFPLFIAAKLTDQNYRGLVFKLKEKNKITILAKLPCYRDDFHRLQLNSAA